MVQKLFMTLLLKLSGTTPYTTFSENHYALTRGILSTFVP